jgi:peptidyl-prolyl cis-trans isomerase B (cyclophilin B)
MTARALLVMLLLALCTACGGGTDESGGSDTTTTTSTTTTTGGSSVSSNDCEQVDQPDAKPDGGQKPPDGQLGPNEHPKLVFDTNCGSFTVTLDPKSAPKTGASLVKLARNGFFDDTIFHRIVQGFVIQGGDPTVTGSGGPGYSTRDKVPANAAYGPGVVAMAKAGNEPAGTAGSQFFVVTGAGSGLTPDYALLGKVTKGMDAVQAIGKLGDPASGGTGTPLQSVVIEKATVSEH